MKSSVKTRPTAWDLLPVALVLLLAAALSLFFLNRSRQGPLTAVISVGGSELCRVELQSLSGEERYSPDGLPYALTLGLSSQGVWVEESACPGQDCVHSGLIRRPGESIVCLPNQLLVRLEGGENALDAVLG